MMPILMFINLASFNQKYYLTKERNRGSKFYLPFLIPLQALRVELLDGNNHSGAVLGRGHRLLVHPAFVHPPKSPFTEDAVWPEVLGGRLELHECVGAEVGRLQDLAVGVLAPLFEPAASAAAAGGSHEAAAHGGELSRGALAGGYAAARLGGHCCPCHMIRQQFINHKREIRGGLGNYSVKSCAFPNLPE